MAAAGARVLLVDADLRRGDLAALFGVHDAVGLSSVLREETRWGDAVQTTEHEALSLRRFALNARAPIRTKSL